MSADHCPHCGCKLPLARDAFCIACGERPDEPPDQPRAPEEQKAFLEQVNGEARRSVSLLGWLFGWGG